MPENRTIFSIIGDFTKKIGQKLRLDPPPIRPPSPPMYVRWLEYKLYSFHEVSRSLLGANISHRWYLQYSYYILLGKI